MIFVVIASVSPVLKTETASSSVIGSKTVTLYSIADAYVDETAPYTNYGDRSYLDVEFNSHLCFAYIMFDLSTIGPTATVLSAELRVYAFRGSWFGPTIGFGLGGRVNIGAYYASSDTWKEHLITWTNKPTFKTEATANHPLGGLALDMGGYWPWNVTSDAKTAFSGGKLTEVLKFDYGENGTLSFRSSETETKPMLIVEYVTDPINNVHIESTQDTGETSNLGHIVVDEKVFALPNEVPAIPGFYNASYRSGYDFVRWETSGNISVSDPKELNTTLMVSGAGTLEVVGNASTVEYSYDDGICEPSDYIDGVKGDIVAVRFTPLFRGELDKASFCFESISINATRNVVRIHVMNDKRQDIVNPFDANPKIGWTEIDLSGNNIEIDSEFYVGVEFTSSPELPGYIDGIHLGVDTDNYNDRNWEFREKEWDNWGTLACYMVRAEVKSSVPVTVLNVAAQSLPIQTMLLLTVVIVIVIVLVVFAMLRRRKSSHEPQRPEELLVARMRVPKLAKNGFCYLFFGI